MKVKFNSESESVHNIFFKQHSIKKDQTSTLKPNERTLFVLNVPSYCTEESIKHVFNCFGHVENVYLNGEDQNIKSSYFKNTTSEINSYKAAYVVFGNSSSLTKSLNQKIEEVKIISTKDRTIHTGLRKWINNYRNQFVDAKDLQKEIDDYMKNYDIEKEKVCFYFN